MPLYPPRRAKFGSTKLEKTKVSPPGKALYGLTLDTSILVLSTLRDAARVATIPHLMEALQLALGILSTIREMKDCKEGFERLASDLCGLVYAISGVHSKTVVIPEDLSVHIKELVETLKSIQAFAEKQLKRKIVLKIIRSYSDRGKILEYREALRQSLDVFGLQSTISIRDNMAQIIEKQNELAVHLERQGTQDLGLKKLLEETLEKGRAEEQTPTSPNSTVLPPPPPPHSKNPFHNPQISPVSPFSTKISGIQPCADIPLGSAPQYHISGDFVSEDRSWRVENTDSNNTTTTNIVGSHNDSSVRCFGS